MSENTRTWSWGTPVNAERAVAAASVDDMLIARFLGGDSSAFDSLFLKYQDYVYNIVYRIVGRPEEARDVAQDVFLQVHRSLKSFRRGARFQTWLYRIAVNRAVDQARAERRWKWLPLNEEAKEAPDPSGSPADHAQKQATRDMAQQAMMMVAPQHRDVLALRYFQDMSIEEISEVLNCSVAAAKVRLHRARNHFKTKYVELIGEDDGSLDL